MSEKAFSFKIENVVATVTVSLGNIEKMDLTVIAHYYSDVEYNPERFPGLVMRIAEPKATILVFSTGKMVVTGMRRADEAEAVVNEVVKRIRKCKIDVSNPEIIIQNIVASGDLSCSVDLNLASVVLESCMYEPEVFPGLIFRMKEPKTVFLIFSTGRVVCTGAKTKEIVAEAVEKLYGIVREAGVAREHGEDIDFDEEEEEMSFL